MVEPIFHIAERSHWDEAVPVGRYMRSTRGASLAEVGFVHCSRLDQVLRVADALFGDCSDDLVLLEIDPSAVDAEVRYEAVGPATPHSEVFPHVYGAVPVGAVVSVRPFGRAGTGRFMLPEE
jgi:uncharacterized protein (DUF952 family)